MAERERDSRRMAFSPMTDETERERLVKRPFGSDVSMPVTEYFRRVGAETIDLRSADSVRRIVQALKDRKPVHLVVIKNTPNRDGAFNTHSVVLLRRQNNVVEFYEPSDVSLADLSTRYNFYGIPYLESELAREGFTITTRGNQHLQDFQEGAMTCTRFCLARIALRRLNAEGFTNSIVQAAIQREISLDEAIVEISKSIADKISGSHIESRFDYEGFAPEAGPEAPPEAPPERTFDSLLRPIRPIGEIVGQPAPSPIVAAPAPTVPAPERRVGETPPHRPYNPGYESSLQRMARMARESRDVPLAPLPPPTQYNGQGKYTFKEQLMKIGITPQYYLKQAQKKAKKAGYDPKMLGFSLDGKHKLAIPDNEGRMARFGRVGYGDHIIYSWLEAHRKEPKGTAEKHRHVFQKSHSKIKGDWKSKPFSPNNLALKVLW